MIREAVGTAATIEEAKEKALAELNASFEDDVQVEVLACPKTKVLGIFGGSPAKVKVSIEAPDPKPIKAPKEAKKPGKKAENKKEKAAKKEEKAPVEVKEIDISALDSDSPAAKGINYLKNILEKLGCNEVNISASEVEGGIQITLTGEGLGVVIGHRGETLDSLQYLVSLAANAGVSGYYRIVLNTGNFRQKREQTLIALAKRMSEQAIMSGKCRTLEPMNPYERRIIHTAVQEIAGVTSTSFGEGSGRRVVIAPEGKEARPRSDYRGARGGHNRNRGGKGGRFNERKEAYKPEVDPNREPVKDADSLPLYGRIDK